MNTDCAKFEELMDVMAKLRGPNGCPWDKQQTHASLTSGFLEELYEFIEAVDDNDIETMREELGDLCLHIVFQVQLAREAGEFTMTEVLEGIIEKLVRRHPHVFGDITVGDADEVIVNWDTIKKKEKKNAARTSVVDGIPRHLPALSKAHKLQRKVRKVGFDWDRLEDVMLKVDEELGELRDAIKEGNQAHVTEELGDLLFSIVNVSRFVDVEPEQALHKTVRKFMNRFRAIEAGLEKRGKTVDDATFEEMDALWEETKKE